MGQSILGQHNGGGAEGVGLDDVGPGIQMSLVYVTDNVGPGENQVLIAALVVQAAEVVGTQVAGLYRRAHRAVQHQDALSQRGFQVVDSLI